MIKVRIGLIRAGGEWRVGRVEIRSPTQYQTVQLDHLRAGGYDTVVAIAKQHALDLLGFPATRQDEVDWVIRPAHPCNGD
jgi:hypothetical protein